jgi:hypothetical protein
VSDTTFVGPAVPQPPRDRAVPLWPSAAPPAAPPARARVGSWILALWLLPVLVVIPIVVLGGVPAVAGLAVLVVALIGMVVHALIGRR